MEPEDEMLQFFQFAHLPPHLQTISKPFGELAALIVEKLPKNSQRDHAVNALVQAKDFAVRAQLYKSPT